MNLLINNSYCLEAVLRLKEEKGFGSEFFLSFFSIFVQSCLYYFVFRAVFFGSESVDANEITLYYIIINIVALSVQAGMYVAYSHMEDINSGAIILHLLRPWSYPLSRYLSSLMQIVSRTLVNMILIYIVSSVFRQPMGVAQILWGFGSVVLGFTILYLIQAVIGCCAVWFRDITRFRDVVYSLLMMLGGRLLPSDLLLDSLKVIVYYTPLPYVYDVPVKILMGERNMVLIGVQIFWIFLLGSVYLYLFQRHVRHNIEIGG